MLHLVLWCFRKGVLQFRTTWQPGFLALGFLPSCAASGTAVGKCSTLAPAALKGGGEGPMGFGNAGSQGQLELLPCLSWGQQEGCEHPLWLLPPLHPKALVCVFGVAWEVRVPSMEMGGTH